MSAAATLVARGGDAQALKALIAAEISGADVELKALGQQETRQAVFGPAAVSLTTAGGATLTEPNAIAAYLGAFAETPQSTSSW
jgi:hypothetical protein